MRRNTEMTKVEYRVKTVERYIVTRYEENENGSAVVERGHYASPHVAFEVAYALCKQEHERLGYEPGDERIQYPEHPHGITAESEKFITGSHA